MTSAPKPAIASSAATTSLVLGILAPFTCLLTALPAAIFGHVALSKIKKPELHLVGKGRAVAGLILGYLFTAALIGLSTFAAMKVHAHQTGAVSPRQLESFTRKAGLVIPPSATATRYKSYFAMDGQAFLKLEIPAEDLDGFLSKSGLEGELNNTTRTKSLMFKFAGELSVPPSKFREGQKTLPRGEALNVLVDEDSPTNVVYLLWFGT